MSWFESALSVFGAPLGGVIDAGSALAAFFDAVTNGRMWRSLGWLVLGIALMGIGLALWLKTEVM